MSLEIPVFTEAEQVAEHLEGLRHSRTTQAALCELGGGVLRFAEVVFESHASDKVYAQKEERELGGRGAHFDVYGRVLDPLYPWVGVYNLAGDNEVRVVGLAEDLGDIYNRSYPDPTEDAYKVRRHYAAIAFDAPGAEISTGQLTPQRGLILPQPIQGPHIVHEVTPVNDLLPGEFVKVLVPAPSSAIEEKLRSRGYKSLDEVVSQSLGQASDEAEHSPDILEGLPDFPSQPRRRRPGLPRLPTRQPTPTKRPCSGYD